MKKIILLSTLILSCTLMHAQVKLNYNKHGLNAGDNQNTQIGSYQPEGNSGQNQFWDFSKVECKGAHSARVTEAINTPYKQAFPEANTAIEENGNFFFFNNNTAINEFWGFVNPNGVIKYDQPVRKMMYPFSYGSKDEGTFTGHTSVSKLDGKYYTVADGEGILKLPGNIQLNNTLRVKSYEYFIETACNSIEVETIKYLWYAKDHRYPVFIVLYRNEKPSEGEPRNLKYTVLNNNYNSEVGSNGTLKINTQQTADIEYKMGPNPFREQLTISYTLPNPMRVFISIYDASYREIAIIADQDAEAGPYSFQIDPVKLGTRAGIYFVKLVLGDKVYFPQVVQMD